MEADAGGADAKSAKKSRKHFPARNLAEAEQDAASEARAGKKKRRRRSVEARGRDDQIPAEADQVAASDSRGGKKMWRRRSVEARERNDPAPAPSSAAESGDCPRKTGSKGSGKQGGRRSKSAAE